MPLRGKSLFFTFGVLAATLLLGLWLHSTRTLQAPADHRVHLRLAALYTSQAMENYQELVDDFNRRNPDLLVELQGVPGSYYDKLLVMFAGRTAPDVMWMGKGMAQFASRNAFLDVEDEFRIPPGHYYESVLDCYRFNGRLMGFPLGADFAVIVYNLDLFEQAGLPPPAPDWTLEDFRQAARRLTVREGGRVRQWGFYGEIDPGVFGAEYLSPDMSEERIDRPQWQSYLDFHLKLIFEDGSMPSRLEIPGAGILTRRQAFYRGEAAMISDGFHFQTMREEIADFRWDIAPVPLGPGGPALPALRALPSPATPPTGPRRCACSSTWWLPRASGAWGAFWFPPIGKPPARRSKTCRARRTTARSSWTAWRPSTPFPGIPGSTNCSRLWQRPRGWS